MKDLYAILGLSKESTEEEIKKAYRKQVLSAHPDKGGDLERMKELNDAYDKLADPEERKQFDEEWEIFHDIDDETSDFSLSGHLTSSAVPFSEQFKQQHSGLIRVFTKKPLDLGSTIPLFKPFHSDIYKDKESGLKNASDGDIFSLLKEKAKQPSGSSTFAEETRSLTPIIAVELFIRFLRGDYYGEALKKKRTYLSTEIKKVKFVSPYVSVNSLYDGILDIFSMTESSVIQADKLLFSIKKIVEYAKQTVHESIPFLAILFQNKYFRNF